MNLPIIDKEYLYKDKIVYTVIGIANIDNINDEYPITVIYKGENESLWTRTLNQFWESFKEYIYPDRIFKISDNHYIGVSNLEIKENKWYYNNRVLFLSNSIFDEGNNPNQNKDNKLITHSFGEKVEGAVNLPLQELDKLFYKRITIKGV